MSFFHRFAFSRHHDHHHGHWHGHAHCGPGDSHFGDEASRIERIAGKITGRLDLNETQQERLVGLLECLQQQRQAIKNVDLAKDIGALIGGERLDREAAKAWVEQRIQSLQTASPVVLTALADFYDALDAEQQQVLRFLLRMRGRFGSKFGGKFGAGRRGHA